MAGALEQLRLQHAYVPTPCRRNWSGDGGLGFKTKREGSEETAQRESFEHFLWEVICGASALGTIWLALWLL